MRRSTPPAGESVLLAVIILALVTSIVMLALSSGSKQPPPDWAKACQARGGTIYPGAGGLDGFKWHCLLPPPKP